MKTQTQTNYIKDMEQYFINYNITEKDFKNSELIHFFRNLKVMGKSLSFERTINNFRDLSYLKNSYNNMSFAPLTICYFKHFETTYISFHVGQDVRAGYTDFYKINLTIADLEKEFIKFDNIFNMELIKNEM